MIRSNFQGNYGFDPVRTFDFTKYIPDGITLYYGFNHADTTGDTNKKVRINLETPNMLYIYDSNYDNANFDLVLHLCPYTCAYLNELHNTQKFKPIFFPIEDIRISNEKTIDVFYTGNPIRGLQAFEMIERTVLRRIGSAFNQLKNYMSSQTLDGYYKKMEILSKTKICIVHNVLTPKHLLPNYYSNDLTRKHLPWDGHDRMVPQLKSRTFEGALMGCILLAYKDEYKTIERYFTEGEEFIYFENEHDLNSKIDTILANYDTYKHIGENAQKRVRENYLTKHLAAIMVKDLSEHTSHPPIPAEPSA